MSKVVIITGAGKGIGRALAIGLSREGFTVVATGRNINDLEKVSKRFKGDYFIKECNLAKLSDCEELVEAVLKKYGRIDVLINNASSWLDKSLMDSTKKEIETIIDVTVKGTTYLTKLCFGHMAKQRSGNIISLLTSTYRYGINEWEGRVLTPYYVAKFGVSGLTEALKIEAKKYKVKVTSLYLGTIASDLDIDDPEETLLAKYKNNKVHVKSVVDVVLFAINQPSVTSIEEIIIAAIGEE